jgi:two-component system cell cycle sensor histidine kinase/response regulator CckA
MKKSDKTEPESRIALLEEEIKHLRSRLFEQSILEEQLRQAQKMEAIAVLSSGVAHDFNNILQSILSRTQLLFMEEGRDTSYGPFKEIRSAVERGAELAKQFLSYGAKRDINFMPLNINKNIQDIYRFIQRTFPKKINIELDLCADLKKINADAGQIDQILMNLCINARDAMPNGGTLRLITENIRLDQTDLLPTNDTDSNEQIHLKISDTGSGIPQRFKENIFKPFFTTKKQGQGTGLGLSMVHSIVRDHKGLIDFSSNVGEGTTFDLYFPVLEVDYSDTVKENFIENKSVFSGIETILLVDDDRSLTMLGKTMLEKFGYTVITANSGEEAIQKYSPKTFDLIILDLDMPRMGGIECLQKMHTLNRKVKVVAVSGHSSDEAMEEAIHSGAKAFIAKPFGIDEFLGTVRSTLDH